MNFITFPVGSTNIFPIANSVSGGQLLTEYNLKSRESISVDPSIKYMAGHSFVHCEDDFLVSKEIGNSTRLTISEGRGVINGHFVETFTPMYVDIADARAQAYAEGDTPLDDELAIGIRIMYSTDDTMAGSMRTENPDTDMYEGIQLVVLPVATDPDKRTLGTFNLPSDVPDDSALVTAHLLLATFTYSNGSIVGEVSNNKNKCAYIPQSRIIDGQDDKNGQYVRRKNLNPGNFYVLDASVSSEDGDDAWVSVNDALVSWGTLKDPIYVKPWPDTATFVEESGKIKLYLPHKRPNSYKNARGDEQYYPPTVLDLPTADYVSGKGGTVDKSFIDRVKQVENYMQTVHNSKSGKQVAYIAELKSKDELPEIQPDWYTGDYVLVGNDRTVSTDISIATMYVIVPGVVKHIRQIGESEDHPTGVQLSHYTYDSLGHANTSASKMEELLNIADGIYFGVVGKDYFTLQEHIGDSEYIVYDPYVVSEADPVYYSEPIHVTGQFNKATESVIGGFYNVPESAQDMGYVYLDTDGHLRLLDYGRLRTGAYQLGHDISVGEGLTADAVNEQLYQDVNDRAAFADYEHKAKVASYLNSDGVIPEAVRDTVAVDIIHLNLTLPASESEESVTIKIENIDSRFGTSVYLHIAGEAGANTTVVISGCEKLRIDSNIGGSPNICVLNSCIFYDADVLDRLSECKGITFWYEQYPSNGYPDLSVDGMTIRVNSGDIECKTIEMYKDTAGDNTIYQYAITGVTFNTYGEIIGLTLAIKNTSTNYIDPGHSMFIHPFDIQRTLDMPYPESRLTKCIPIDGTFLTAYRPVDDTHWVVNRTTFNATTANLDTGNSGTITLLVSTMNMDIDRCVVSDTILYDTESGSVAINGIDPNSSWHMFEGHIIP